MPSAAAAANETRVQVSVAALTAPASEKYGRVIVTDKGKFSPPGHAARTPRKATLLPPLPPSAKGKTVKADGCGVNVNPIKGSLEEQVMLSASPHAGCTGRVRKRDAEV